MAICFSVPSSAAENSGNVWHFGVFHGAQRPGGFAAGRAFSFLLVGDGVERDKEDEVRGDYAHASESSEFLTSALACVGHPWEVG